MCSNRSAYYRQPLAHLFTSRNRKMVDGQWTEWIVTCCWCGRRRDYTFVQP